ncbi:hypothetical protein ACLOJK_017165 [Asimina triloba]
MGVMLTTANVILTAGVVVAGILIDGRDPNAVDFEGSTLPTLVYLSREKRPGYHHNFKAGALNALIRMSFVVSNGPIILSVDCDMYSNNAQAARDAMRCFMDENKGHEIAYVQYPQGFHNLTKNDMYAGSYKLIFELGMGSALETLCGQAFGAGKLRMLGVYMQRSWIILLCTALILVPVYVFAPPILKLMGETSEISDLAGKFSLWMLPQLFAYAVNFPIQKYLQAQRKVMTMAVVAAVVLVINVVASWLLILQLEWGLVGAAVSLNSSFWLLNFGQMAYIWSGTCGEAWSGFSWLAFTDLYQFLKLSIASAVMLCLEYWYLMLLIVLTGRLKNPLIPVDAISALVAYINVACYYLFGLPAGLILGFKLKLGVEGMWGGMIGGIILQTIVLVTVTSYTNWKKEAAHAESRIKKWGGSAGEESS